MVEIDIKVLIVQIVTFLLGFLLLWKTGLRYLADVLHRRKEQIRKDLEQAQQTRQEMEKIKADFDRKLADSKQQSQVMLDEALKAANDQKIKIIEESKSEAKNLIEKARQEIERETQIAKKEIQSEVASLALLVAEKVLGRSIDQVIQKVLVEDVLKDLNESH